MSKTKIVLAGLLLCSALLMTAAAQSSHNARNIPVTSTILDSDNSVPTQIYSDSSVVGGSTVYTNSSTLLSVVSPAGCWHIGNNTTGTPTLRKFGIDLTMFNVSTNPTDPNDISQSDVVFPTAGFGLVSFTTAQIIAGCDQITGQNMFNMTTNPIYAPLLVQFLSDGTVNGNYRLSIGDSSLDPDPNPLQIPLTKAKITCNLGTVPNKCTDWTIESADSLQPAFPSNGTLWKIPATHPYKGWTYYGNYNFSFSIHVSIQ